MRERDRRFAEAFVREIGATGGDISDAALLRAGEQAYVIVPDKRLLAHVKRKLKQGDVREAIGDAYLAATGFDLSAALKKHHEHILNGNYQALKDYLSWTLPSQPKRLQVQTQAVPYPAGGMPQNPQMRARQVGTALPAARTVRVEDSGDDA